VRVQELGEAVIDAVCQRLREQLPAGDAEQAERFARQYYRWVAPDDIAERSELDVYGAALAHFNFARGREPGTPKVRVYNPRFEAHGWQSTHTAVEIVTDDMPFLIDSVGMELSRRGFGVHVIIHPVISVRRDGDGQLLEVLESGSADAEGATTESVIHAEVDRQTDEAELETLSGHLLRVIGEVRAAVEDWRAMRAQALAIVEELGAGVPAVEAEDSGEARAFLEWLESGHFTFLGYRDYDLVEEGGELGLRPVPGTGLGILRDAGGANGSGRFRALPSEVRELAREPFLLNLAKANSRATVHRPAYLDYVGVKRLDAGGEVIGERRFLGLYTTTAYHASLSEIPILRRKRDIMLARAAFPKGSHNEKALIEILESHPRDEMLQTPVDELLEIAMAILHLGERQRLRLIVRRDGFGRFLSCLVFVPRDRFNTENRRRIERILLDAFEGSSIDYTTRVSESVLVRLHYMVYTEPGWQAGYDVSEIEGRLLAATRAWADDFEDALIEEHGEELGNDLHRRYGDAFPAAYRADWVARAALADVQRIEDLEPGGLAISLYQPLEAPPGVLRAKVFRRESPLALSDMLPAFENMGVVVADERPYEVAPHASAPAWIYDFGLSYSGDAELATGAVRESFQEAFIRTWRGDAENDGYNRLVLRSGLSWREVIVLRAAAKYLRQAGTTFSDTYVEEALVAHPRIAGLLVELFHAHLDPARADEVESRRLVASVEKEIDAVESLDQDRILRQFLDLIGAILRTNYFQAGPGGEPQSHLSFKLDPSRLPWLPLPRPQFEIFVYSPRVEGVHLRGGKVARGGLRWSDRREDFRTEVLGLMKAQMVKNAVIVPVGAKGGFVVKRPPPEAGRDALQEEVIACYRTFIRGLLDLTDNIVAGEIVPPAGVVRYDGDDPYLVVAADKGTATFSDIANAIAVESGFWLGDAFASGGSSGYDHKKMGITARGAWESIKRQFREMGRDTQQEDFTVVGVGDMSGDVFGNGMLLSRHIRLVGAFNHRDIFIDPDPDPEATWEERRRLFELPRSSWSDYDASLISEGGGVYSRSAKSIALSPQARAALGVEAEAIAPNDLVHAMMLAPVDLWWNGGIGTYVKASGETHADVGDKANEAVRVNARELRCRVIGEGGNLGMTQLARIEFALAGGRVNTDAIDNSAGVDCSDHEVNIKILLDAIVAAGDLTDKQRDELLAQMTDEVAELVLKDNYEQGETLSLAQEQASSMLDVHARLIRSLEQSGRLHRELESLPSDEEIAERKATRAGLTRPELSTLVAYSKLALYDDLLDSDVPEDPHLSAELLRYFPGVLSERFPEPMQAHRLRREIIATKVVNNMLHGGGTTFAFRLHEELGAAPPETARAYAVARDVFQMRPLWAAIESLDDRIATQTQTAMLLEGRKLVERATRWLLRNRRRPLPIAETVAFFSSGAEVLYDALPRLLAPEEAEQMERRMQELCEAGVPGDVAQRVASLGSLFSALDIVEVARETALDIELVGAVHFRLGSSLQIHWLRGAINELPRDDRWSVLARAALREDLSNLHRALTGEVLLATSADADVDERVSAWVASNPASERFLATLAEIRLGHVLDTTTLPVAVREVRNLIQAPAA